MSLFRDLIVTPWVSSTFSKNGLTVVVVSSNYDIIKNISEALVHIHAIGDFRWKLEVLRASSLEDIAKQSVLTGKKSIDFVVIGVDTNTINCIKWVREALEQVHPDLRIRRVILVNANTSKTNAMAVKSSEIIAFCLENKLEMLNSNVLQLKDVQFLARKLLKYIEVSIGVKTGIPNLNV